MLPILQEESRIGRITPGQRKKVSCDVVIIYHTANLPFLQEAVNSILNQTAANCVIHLVADAVPLDLDFTIDMFADRENIRFYRTTKQIGPYRATNCLFPFLETEFIAVHDSDDIALPNRIWRSITLLEETHSDILGATMEQFIDYRSGSDRNLETRLLDSPFHVSGVAWKLCPTGIMIHGTMVLRKRVFAAMNGYADLMASGDCEFSYRAHVAGHKFYVTDQIVSMRRLHNSSMTGTDFSKNSADQIDITESLLKTYKDYQRGTDLSRFGSLDKYLKMPLLEKIPSTSLLTKRKSHYLGSAAEGSQAHLPQEGF